MDTNETQQVHNKFNHFVHTRSTKSNNLTTWTYYLALKTNNLNHFLLITFTIFLCITPWFLAHPHIQQYLLSSFSSCCLCLQLTTLLPYHIAPSPPSFVSLSTLARVLRFWIQEFQPHLSVPHQSTWRCDYHSQATTFFHHITNNNTPYKNRFQTTP